MSLSVLPREYSNKCVIRFQGTIFPVSTNWKGGDVGLYRNYVDNSWHHYLRDENCRNTKAAETCKKYSSFPNLYYIFKQVCTFSKYQISGNSNKSALLKVPDFRHFIYTSMKQPPSDTKLFVPLLFKFFASMTILSKVK